MSAADLPAAPIPTRYLEIMDTLKTPPVQDRGRRSVAAILASAESLIEHGQIDRFTTAQVADLAGVSIGLLYRYFPDRVAILDAVRPHRYAPAPINATGEQILKAASIVDDLHDDYRAEEHPEFYDAVPLVTAAARAAALGRLLPAPGSGCTCAPHLEAHGETTYEYDPACPEHSEHVYNPRTGTWEFATDPTPGDLRGQLAEALSGMVYVCTRSWEAWQVGTMTVDDFTPAWLDDELIDSLIHAVTLGGVYPHAKAAALREAADVIAAGERAETVAYPPGHRRPGRSDRRARRRARGPVRVAEQPRRRDPRAARYRRSSAARARRRQRLPPVGRQRRRRPRT